MSDIAVQTSDSAIATQNPVNSAARDIAAGVWAPTKEMPTGSSDSFVKDHSSITPSDANQPANKALAKHDRLSDSANDHLPGLSIDHSDGVNTKKSSGNDELPIGKLLKSEPKTDSNEMQQSSKDAIPNTVDNAARQKHHENLAKEQKHQVLPEEQNVFKNAPQPDTYKGGFVKI